MSGIKFPHVRQDYLDLVDRFGKHLTNTGGNDPRELLNDLGDPAQKYLASTNMVRFTLAVAVQSQVALLSALVKDGIVGDAAPHCATCGCEVA